MNNFLSGMGNLISIIWCILVSLVIIVFLKIYTKRNPYSSVNKHYIAILGVIGILLVIYPYVGLNHFADKNTLASIADNIASGAIFGIFCVISLHKEKEIKNKYEDSIKLTTNYEKLATLYKKCNLVEVEGITYPIIRLGVGNISLANETNNHVEIKDSPGSYYQLPNFVESHFEEIFQANDTSNVYNNVNVRVVDLYIYQYQKLYLDTERTYYYNLLVTNRACDFKLSDCEGLSIRQLYEPGPTMTELKYSKLSNHLGFNGFIESSDGYIPFIYRSNKVSVGKNTYGDSINASLKLEKALDEKGYFNYQGLKNAIIGEIEDELKISKDQLDLSSLCIFAAYRDCVECGKPQLLIYTKVNSTESDITTKFIAMKKEKEEKKKQEKKKLSIKANKEREMKEDGESIVWIKRDDLIHNIKYTYDGIIIKNCDVKSYDKDGNVSSVKQELKMVPSASATIYLLTKYLKTETKLEAKTNDPDKCEDGLFIGEKIIAVIDGVTSKGKLKWNGSTSGKYAKDVIYEYLSNHEEFESAEDFFQKLSQCLNHSRYLNEGCKIEDYPRACVIAYSTTKKEIWSYGDCQCLINGVIHDHEKLIDQVTSNKRVNVIKNEILKNGEELTMKRLKEHDFGRDAIVDDLKNQLEYENKHVLIDGLDYGYPVLNGEPILSDMIVSYKVNVGDHVVLASDGYPILKETLKESEEELSKILAEDPMCFKIYKSTKGIQKGNISFDDRTYISFNVNDFIE